MEHHAFQQQTEDWAHLSRLNGDDAAAAEFEAYSGSGKVADTGLLHAAMKLAASRLVHLHDSMRDLVDFQKHIMAILRNANAAACRS